MPARDLPPLADTAPPLAGVALLSAGALAFEVLLTRLFAIIQWHHFSYMIISLALLGYGASGSFLAVLGERARRRFRDLFIANAVFFAITLVGCFLAAQQIPFNALEIAWDFRQLGYLLVLYVLLAVPFFCVANAIGLALFCHRAGIHRIYAVDLIGAGGGALGIILLLFLVPPLTALWLLGAVGLLAAGLAAWPDRRRMLGVAALGLGVMGMVVWLPDTWTRLRLSPYKDVQQALRVAGAEGVAERSSPLGLIQVVRNTQVPFRYAPGLSLAAPYTPPPQLGLFSDGDELGAITRFTGDGDSVAYLDYLTSALPFHLLDRPRVLVLGAGGGMEVLQALFQQARSIDAVELNPQIVELVRGRYRAFSGGIYEQPSVRLHIGEARRFVAAGRQRYDLIQLAWVDAVGAGSAGLHALSENYLYTVEAFRAYLRHLQPGGLLAITRWLELPPRDILKLFATATAALEQTGVNDPGAQLLLIRGWKSGTLVLKNGAFTEREIAALRLFCRQRAFDLAWYPGITAAETNQFNVWQRPYLYEAAAAILSPRRAEFLAAYKFDLTPASDDQPYFFRFFKWRTLPELLGLRAGAGLGQVEWGYLILVATLLQAGLVSGVLIVLPLALAGFHGVPKQRGERRRVLVYFGALGLAFLMLEIAFIQKLILLLGHPLYAVAVALCAFLVFAGLGSAYSRRRGAYPAARPTGAVMAITGAAAVYTLLLPELISHALTWPDPLRVLCAVLLIAPLAFAMGMPFPLVLARLAATTPALLPWAWAINGCASVVSAVVGTWLAVHFGFSGVVGVALLLYWLAVAAMPGRHAAP